VIASRTHWRLLVGTILVLMAAAWLAPRFVQAPDIQENRVLAAKPAWPQRVQDIRAFRKAADAYVADNFPVRPHLIGLLNRARMIVGVSGSSRVIVGRHGWLFVDDDTHLGVARGDPPVTGPQVRSWLMTVAGRTEYARAHGAPYLIVSPPTKDVVYPQHGPSWYRGPNPDRQAVALARLAIRTGAGEVIYLYPAIAEATARGEKTYSLHDTHWTGYGAYAGYAALMRRLQAMGLTEGPLPISAFRPTTLYGRARPRDLALMLGVSSFVDLDYPNLDNPGGRAKAKITYLSAAHDWTGPQVVDTGEVGKPVLLLTRDSFSNELLPLLYPHFSRIILSHNQDGFWRPDLIDRFKPDLVISEIVESGLRVGVAEGPPPSAEAVARIDKVLGVVATQRPAAAPSGTPTLSPPDVKTLAIMAAAKPTPDCNLEKATLEPGVGGQAQVTVSGWISELGPSITSPRGLVSLKGPAGAFTAQILVNGSRPDVATFFKAPTGAESGFLGTYYVKKLPPGAYTPSVYRRTPDGWIVCVGGQSLSAP